MLLEVTLKSTTLFHPLLTSDSLFEQPGCVASDLQLLASCCARVPALKNLHVLMHTSRI